MKIYVYKKNNNGVNNMNSPEKIFSFEFALKSIIKFFFNYSRFVRKNGAGGHRYGGYTRTSTLVIVQALETFGEW